MANMTIDENLVKELRLRGWEVPKKERKTERKKEIHLFKHLILSVLYFKATISFPPVAFSIIIFM